MLADNMFKSKTDPDLVVVGFVKSLYGIFNARAMVTIFVISGNGCILKWQTR